MRRPGPWMLPVVAAAAMLAPLLVAPGSAAAEPHPLATVCGSLRDQAASSAAHVGFVVLDLADGTRCSSNAGQTFRSASLYKLVVLAEAYRQQSAGMFSLDEAISIEARHYLDDPEELRRTWPVVMSAREALRRMIIISSNPEANALHERLDPVAVQAAPARLGLLGTALTEGNPFLTTPADIALLLTTLYDGGVVSESASAEMLDLLRRQEINDLIPAALPAGTTVAHKTGRIEQYLHDAGIVFAPGGDYVMVLMTRWADDINESYAAIYELTDLVHGAFLTPFEATAPSSESRAAANEAAISDRALERIPRVVSIPFVAPAESLVAPAESLVVPAAAWWWDSRVQIMALAALALAFAALVLRPRVFALAPFAQSDARDRLSDRFDAVEGQSMRFGSRSRDGEEAVAAEPEGWAGDADVNSQRLQRMIQYFSAQSELLDEMRTQVEQEIAPLISLLRSHEQTTQRMLSNLDTQLRPLADYAEGEEANLTSLEQQLDDDGSDFVSGQFQTYVLQQRQRIVETLERIAEQRGPFVSFGEKRDATVEVAVARFDGDVDALEQNLAEQRKVMMRMLDAMRSESFAAVRNLLHDRESEIAETVAAGDAHPGRMSERLLKLGDSLRETDDAGVKAVIAASDLADEHLGPAGPGGPRPLHAPEPDPLDAGDEAEERDSA